MFKIPENIYKKCNYLQSSGTQWINTNKKPYEVGKWELDALFTSLYQKSGSFVGNGSFPANDNRFDIGITNTGKFWLAIGAQDTTITSDTNRHTFILDRLNAKAYIDSTELTYADVTWSTTATDTIYLANRTYYGGSTLVYQCSEKIYSSKMWDNNNVLVQSLQPVLRIADSKPGFFDEVTGEFFTNAGTGEFTYELALEGLVTAGALNKFDRDSETLDKYLPPSTGEPANESNSAYCDYIPVTPNTTYTVSFLYKHSGYFMRIHGYNSSKTWTALIWQQSTGTIGTTVTQTITTGSSDYYIRASYPKLDEEIMFVEGSTAPTSYIPYKFGSKEAYGVTNNLFDKDNLTRYQGYFPSSNSSWTYASTGYSIRIACKPNTSYTAKYFGTLTQAVLSFASTYSDDVPSSTVATVPVTNSIRQSSPTSSTPITITTGANDKWLIVQYNVATEQNEAMRQSLVIVEGSTAPTSYIPHIGYIGEIYEGKYSLIEGERYNNDGTITTDSTFWRSDDYISVTGGMALTITGTIGDTNSKIIVYDSNKTRVDWWNLINRDLTLVATSAYIRVSGANSIKDTVTITNTNTEEVIFKNDVKKIYDGGYNISTSGNPSTLSNARAKEVEYSLSGNTEKYIDIDGTEYKVPDGYTLVDYIENTSVTKVQTGVIPSSANQEIYIRFYCSGTGSMYLFQSRGGSTQGSKIYGITGSSAGGTLQYIIQGESVTYTLTSTVTRTAGHTYTLHGTCDGTNMSFYVKDETDGTEDTVTGTISTFTAAESQLDLFANEAPDYLGTGYRILSCYYKENGILKLCYAPAKQNSTVGFYDFVSNTIITPVSSTVTAGNELPTPDQELIYRSVGDKTYLINGQYYDEPDNITFLDYVEQGGTASYINTGVYVNLETSKILYDGYETTSFSLWGTAVSTSYYGITGSAGKYRFDYDGTNTSLEVAFSATRHKFVIVGNKCYIDGELVCEHTAKTGTAVQPLYLHARISTGGSVNDHAKNARCYGFGVWADGTTPSIYYQPAKRISDSVVGFYDVVNSTFIEPTSGTLLAGDKLDPCCKTPLLRAENCGMHILTGTESWNRVADNKFYPSNVSDWSSEYREFVADNTAIQVASNEFEAHSWNTDANKVSGWSISLRKDGQYSYIRFLTTGISTIEELNAYFAKRYAEGNPVVVWFPRNTDQSFTTPTTTNIYTDEPLREVGSYADVLHSGDSKVHRKIDKITFDGTETWTYDSASSRFYTNLPLALRPSGSKVLPANCSHFRILCNGESSINAGEGYIGVTTSSNPPVVYLHSDITSLSDWTTWLASNNVSLEYIMDSEEEESVDCPTISTVKGLNYIEETSTVKGDCGYIYRKRSK